MSTITVRNSPEAAFEAEKDRRTGLLRRIFQGIIESRRMSCERKVGARLDGLSDAHLSDLGFSAAEIEARGRLVESRAHRAAKGNTLSKSMTPSTEAAWPYAQEDSAGAASATRSGWSRIVAAVQAYRAALAERRRRRRAMAELERLDDRMLRDIGVTRSEIGRVVRHGRGY